MYEDYFGLERPPFKITPDTSLFYEGGKRGDILSALAYTIHRGEGIIKVVGEVGSGKTMLCRMLQLKLPDTVEIVYIANPSVSAEDILFVIAHELSLPVDKDASKHQVMHMLQDYLLQRHMENKQVVLFIEEAQGMPLDTLEEIRLLSNLETAEHKLLQIILFGQPELDQNLAERSIRQLRERITHNFELEPLTQDEIHNYLNFRMRQVGYTGPELISDTVARKIEQHSAGLLRRINIIADKILLSAFAEGTHNLSAKHVNAAVNDSSFDQESPRRSRSWWWLAPLLLLVLAAALYQTRSQWLAMIPPAMFESPATSVADDGEPTQTMADGNSQGTVEIAGEGTAETPIESASEQATENTAEIANKSVAETTAVSAAGTTAESTAEMPAGEVTAEQAETGASESVDFLPESSSEASLSDQAATSGNSMAPTGNAGAAELESPDPDLSATADETVVSGEQEDLEALSAQVDSLLAQVEVAVQEAGEPSTVPATDALQSDSQPLDDAAASASADASGEPETGEDYRQWLYARLELSAQWLNRMDRDKMSIQVMMRKKSAVRELVYYLRNEWPLDLSQTYMYEVEIEGRSIYRVLYSEFDNLAKARMQIDELPDSIKVNSPYVLSIHQMRKALL